MGTAETLQALYYLGASPMMIGYLILFLLFLSLCIYFGIKFFSHHKFRGISFGIFTKLISLNEYILKFHDQLFEDFTKIKRYYAKHKGDSNFYLQEIPKFNELMSGIKDKGEFDNVVQSFFEPNSYRPSVKKVDSYNKQVVKIQSVFKYLKEDTFHDGFAKWLNYDSIWNFVRTDHDHNELLESLVYKYILDEDTTKYIFFDNLKQKIKANDDDKFKALIMNDDELNNLRHMMQDVIIAEACRAIGIGGNQINVLKSLLFSGPSVNSLNDGAISQGDNNYVDDGKDIATLLNKIGISRENVQDLLKSLSFIDTMTVLSKNGYKVKSNSMFDGVQNVHEHIKAQLEESLTKPRNDHKEKYMIIQNACYQLFNEMFYTKYVKDGKNEFMFHTGEIIDETKFMQSSKIWRYVQIFFNVHLVNSFKTEVEGAINYMKLNSTDVSSLALDAHVSIARLKYLIQDYFKTIELFNNRSNPDRQDITNFWEKRVNSFGFTVADTPKNKPKTFPTDAKYSEYMSDPTNAKLGVVYKNTPLAMFMEYLSAVWLNGRHPKIPLFQSLIGILRTLIPPPEKVLSDFMSQIKGKPKVKSDSQPVEYDYSFKYDPEYNPFPREAFDAADPKELTLNEDDADTSGLIEQDEAVQDLQKKNKATADCRTAEAAKNEGISSTATKNMEKAKVESDAAADLKE
jgi:hypothetical protein